MKRIHPRINVPFLTRIKPKIVIGLGQQIRDVENVHTASTR